MSLRIIFLLSSMFLFVNSNHTYSQLFGGQIKTKKGVLTSLDCSNSIINGSLFSGIQANGVTLTIAYSGGNGGNYSSYFTVSTGVTGLTASLSNGKLNNGFGNLIFDITGIPSTTGNASFNINIAGQSCLININVQSYVPTVVNIFPSNGDISCNSSYSFNWIVPNGVSNIKIEIWGGGGGGGSRNTQNSNYSHAGGGGAYCSKTFTVSADDAFNISLGGGGCGSPNWFTAAGYGQNTTVQKNGVVIMQANGGEGAHFINGNYWVIGLGSSYTYCLNGCDSQFSGGNGGKLVIASSKGPGGGGGAGSGGNGSNGGASSIVGVGGISAFMSLPGGNGGGCNTYSDGLPGSNIGGGGGGGSTGGWFVGGQGGDGFVRITY